MSGPQQVVPMKTVLSHVLVPIVMGLVMAAAYLGGFHKPAPHNVPLAVVGTTQQAQPIADALQHAVGDAATVRVVPNTAEATREIQQLDLSGAYVPGAHQAVLLTGSAASDSTKTVVTQVFSPVALKQGVPLSVKDVAPVTAGDPIGQNGFFFLVALTVGAYATSIAIGAAAASRRFRDRVGLAAGAAVVLSTAELAVAHFGYDMFGGHVPAVWGLSILYTAAVMFVGVGLHPLVGRFSTLLYSAVFVALNFTSSGGVFSPVLQPAFFGWLHHFWIGAGFVETLRRMFYFPAVGLGGPLAILFGWLVLGIACLGLGYAVEQRRARRTATGTHVDRSTGRLDSATEEELEEDVAV
ncbi:hypothetical protein [Allobranchiibius huperziae]|uniref:DUF3533 domain-containing protein n=1 Tax=Allobranchiibius huperziae TaxID=1874116 RepID=A0A853DAQ8_9MICO|nr:hypothetical protein [Allobranchiibius huperziae]